jgi:hypothetical protein
VARAPSPYTTRLRIPAQASRLSKKKRTARVAPAQATGAATHPPASAPSLDLLSLPPPEGLAGPCAGPKDGGGGAFLPVEAPIRGSGVEYLVLAGNDDDSGEAAELGPHGRIRLPLGQIYICRVVVGAR